MDDVIEIILDLLLEGGMEIASNNKISKWIRYPIIFLISIVFIFVILLIMYFGYIILKNNRFIGLLVIILGIIMFILSIKKFKKMYFSKKKNT